MILVVVSDAWSIGIAIAVFIFSFDLFIQHSVLCQCGTSLRFLLRKRTPRLQVAPFVLRHLGNIPTWSHMDFQAVVIFNQHFSHGVLARCTEDVSMTSLRGNKCHPSLERSKDLGFLEIEFSSRVMAHCQKMSKVLVSFISCVCSSGLLYIIVDLRCCSAQIWPLALLLHGWLATLAGNCSAPDFCPLWTGPVLLSIDLLDTAWYLCVGHLL